MSEAPASPPVAAAERRPSAAARLWAWLRVRKKWWLLPIVVVLGALVALAALTRTGNLSPFVYNLF